MSKKTPLYDKHKALGAKLVEFGGFVMPVWYKGTKEEHSAVRNKVGLFDINHMGQIIITGHDKNKLVNYVITNDLKKLDQSKILYSYICNDKGIMLDDLLVYYSGDKIMLIVNAGQSDMLVDHIKRHGGQYQFQIENISVKTGFLALQGPLSFELCKKVFNEDIEKIEYYSFISCEYNSKEIMISRTGYTGEKGVELIFDGDFNEEIWDTLLKEGEQFGIEPCGLAARDMLRLEMGYPLFGHELKGRTPNDILKNWCVSYDKDDFVGKAELEAQKVRGKTTKLVAFEMLEKAVPREEYEVYKDNKKIGIVTSGGFSLELNKGIGLCIVEHEQGNIDNEISIKIRGKEIPAKVCKIPFVPSRVK